jgi:protein-disulfide isomerase
MANPQQVQLEFKHYPLGNNAATLRLHNAAAAAAEQGKFWQMHDLLFANSGQVDDGMLRSFAKLLQMDLVRFEQDLGEATHRKRIELDRRDGLRLDVRGAPTLFVNGTLIDGVPSPAHLQSLIEALLPRVVGRLQGTEPIRTDL